MEALKKLWEFILGLPQSIYDFNTKMLTSTAAESYTRTAGMLTLSCYLIWASYRVIFKDSLISAVDIPPYLALLVAGLYGLGEYWKSKGNGA